jgi:hypothetical protein
MALGTALLPAPGRAQYVITSEAGDSLTYEATTLRVMLDTARALYADLEQDPRVQYMIPVTRPNNVSETEPEPSYPWNVVTVVNDSMADVTNLPANLREADRAYYNYAVMRMRVVRTADPDVPCDSLLALEEEVVGSFADGWIVARTLFGGPAFAPLDEIAFAREAGLLRPMLAAMGDRQIGACAGEWAEANADRVAAYEAWRSARIPDPGAPDGEDGAGTADADPEPAGASSR